MTLHYISVLYFALLYTTVDYITLLLDYITLPLRYLTLHCLALRYITLHIYTTCMHAGKHTDIPITLLHYLHYLRTYVRTVRTYVRT